MVKASPSRAGGAGLISGQGPKHVGLGRRGSKVALVPLWVQQLVAQLKLLRHSLLDGDKPAQADPVLVGHRLLAVKHDGQLGIGLSW